MENTVFIILICVGVLIIALAITSVLLNKKNKKVTTKNDVNFLVHLDDEKQSTNSTKNDSILAIMDDSLITVLIVSLFWFLINILALVFVFSIVFFIDRFITEGLLLKLTLFKILPFTSVFSLIGVIYTLMRVRDHKIKYED